jgi:hypothetical protein
MSPQIEDQLRAAIDAKAASVRSDRQLPWIAPSAARGRLNLRRATIWMAPLATAAAVFLLVVLTSTLGPHHSGPASVHPLGVPTSNVGLDSHSINWQAQIMPAAATCLAGESRKPGEEPPTLPPSTFPRELSWDITNPAYGPLEGAGTTDAALLTVCRIPALTGSGLIKQSLVVFSVRSAALTLLGVVHPVNQVAGRYPTSFSDPIVSDGQVTVQEAFYGPNDSPAQPTGRASTVFRYDGGTFTAESTITQQPT